MIAAAFYPKDVIVRLSDFKTNEYANLIGGRAYEPTEENPMIGFRGASRYYDPRYRDGFALECRAHEEGPRRDGPDEREAHDPVLPHGRGRAGACMAEMAKHGLQARRGRAGGLRHVRDSQQRDPGRANSPRSSTASRSARTT